MKFPKSKNSDFIVQSMGEELLVYNLQTHRAFALNETSKIIYEACDGNTSFDDIKNKYGFNDDLIFLTLDELKKNKLLDENYEIKFTGLSRRAVIKQIGLATMVALPLVISVQAQGVMMFNGSCNCPPEDIPSVCVTSGNYSRGCIRRSTDCLNPASHTHMCCSGSTSMFVWSMTNGCCSVTCTPTP